MPPTRFVINLSSSTTPVSLTPPDHAGLKRFTFFVSRRREEGRERFRLHMGYFSTQEEAEKLLDIVREIYPGAWAGLAPGQKLRNAANVAAAEAAAEKAPASTRAAVEPATLIDDSTPIADTVVTPVIVVDPVVAAAPVPTAVAAAAPVELEPTSDVAPIVSAAEPVTTASTVEMPAITPPPAALELTLVPDEGRQVATNTTAPSIGTDSSVGVAQPLSDDEQAAVRSLSNVRAAIASLDDNAAKAPTLKPIPQLKPAVLKVVPPALPVAPSAKAEAELNDATALKVLEGSNIDDLVVMDAPPAEPAPVSRSAKKDAAPLTEKPQFAVQLMWSVTPIDMAQVPQLAIFGAYTLYGAEGNRDGRRWYGLRLGFFTDAVSAKQVAHYVRSEFATVSVVPVTVRERERARLAATRPATAPVTVAVAAPAKEPKKSEFEFIEDKTPAAAGKAADAKSAAAARPTTGRAPGKRAKIRPPGQVNGRARSKPMTLEETLEILGAGQLQVDNGRDNTISSGGKTPNVPAKQNKSSRLGKLFERLSGLGN